MRQLILAITALFGMTLWAQTDVQFQAHVPFQATEVSFSAYIATESFNEDSRLNTEALWFVENQKTPVSNGMINTVLASIPDSVFLKNEGKIYLYSYVNGQSIGRLPFYRVPYALSANYSFAAEIADVAKFAQDAEFAGLADSAIVSGRADTATFAESANFAGRARRSVFSDTADYAKVATLAMTARSARTAEEAQHALHADTADWAHRSGRSQITNMVDVDGVGTDAIQTDAVVSSKIAPNTILSSHIADDAILANHMSDGSVQLSAIDGGNSATVGSYLTRGVSGISWETNPQHRTTAVEIYTFAPAQLPNSARWVVSRVAVDYNLAPVTSPIKNQLVTIYNGSTANTVVVDPIRWSIDTGLTCWIYAGESKTLWYNGTNWVVIQ